MTKPTFVFEGISSGVTGSAQEAQAEEQERIERVAAARRRNFIVCGTEAARKASSNGNSLFDRSLFYATLKDYLPISQTDLKAYAEGWIACWYYEISPNIEPHTTNLWELLISPASDDIATIEQLAMDNHRLEKRIAELKYQQTKLLDAIHGVLCDYEDCDNA